LVAKRTEITMAWTELTRRQHAREGDKYASDLTDAEWASIAPFMPPPKTTGRPRTTSLRDVFNAILYMATTGCQWRMLPNDFRRFRRYGAVFMPGAMTVCSMR
jgi:hypothetical protein